MGHRGLAVLLALVCAVLFATAAVVEHRVANSATVEPGRSAALRLILRLVRSRAWLVGQLCSAVGFVVHGLSLRFGPVVLVQPILSFGLVITLVMGAVVDRRHPDRPLPSRAQWASAAVVVLGLVMFLRTAHPRHGEGTGKADVLMTGGLAVLLLGVAALAWNHNHGHAHRALALGVAAGCGFGMTGVLLKQVVHESPTSWSAIWPLLLLVLCGGTSIICAQSAYQAGALIESAAVLTGDGNGTQKQFLLARLRLMISTPALRAKHLDNFYALQQAIVQGLGDDGTTVGMTDDDCGLHAIQMPA